MKKNNNYIVLLDPALQDNEGSDSANLGDLIISESIQGILRELFPAKEIIRISTHVEVETKKRKLVNEAIYSFVGGTNLLTSDIRKYRQFYVRKGGLVWLFPGINNLILLGCGWGVGYGRVIHFKTGFFYRRMLHRGINHSLRDQYSADKLKEEAGINSINTSCPTTWNIRHNNQGQMVFKNVCLFTLTDYNTNLSKDDSLLKIVMNHFEKIVFFPQGAMDVEYLQTIPAYKSNRSRISILPHSYKTFTEFIANNSFTYIGTRLHAGIKCIEYGHPSMIIAIDNRASEIARDIHLPICSRNDYSDLRKWIGGAIPFKNEIQIPYSNITDWKNQFLSFNN